MVISIKKLSKNKKNISVLRINKVKGFVSPKNQDLKMASIPQGAFAACKIRSYKEKDMMVSRMPSSTGKPNSTKHYQNEKCKSNVDYVKVNLCRYLFDFFVLFLCVYHIQ
ncbi:hypothetical protein ACFFRR_008118 [Megaselia abdita]